MSSKKKRPISVCNFCRKRKIKCDKQEPCSSCVKFGNEKCEYGNEDNDVMANLAAVNTGFLKLNDLIGGQKTDELIVSIVQKIDEFESQMKNSNSVPRSYIISNHMAISDNLHAELNARMENPDFPANTWFTGKNLPSFSLPERQTSLSPYSNYTLGDFFDDANIGQFNDQFLQYNEGYTEEHDDFWEKLLQNAVVEDWRTSFPREDMSMIVDIDSLPRLESGLSGQERDLGFLSISNGGDRESSFLSGSSSDYDAISQSHIVDLSFIDPRGQIGGNGIQNGHNGQNGQYMETDDFEIDSKFYDHIIPNNTLEPTPSRQYSLGDYFDDVKDGRFDKKPNLHIKYSISLSDGKFWQIFTENDVYHQTKQTIFNYAQLRRFDGSKYYLRRFCVEEQLPIHSDLETIDWISSFPQGISLSTVGAYLLTIFPPTRVIRDSVDFFFKGLYCFVPIFEETSFKDHVDSLLVIDDTDPTLVKSFNITSDIDIIHAFNLLLVCRLVGLVTETSLDPILTNSAMEIADICACKMKVQPVASLQLSCLLLYYYSITGEVEKLEARCNIAFGTAVAIGLHNLSGETLENRIWYYLLWVSLNSNLNYNLDDYLLNVFYTTKLPQSNSYGPLSFFTMGVTNAFVNIIPSLIFNFKRLRALLTNMEVWDLYEQISTSINTIEKLIYDLGANFCSADEQAGLVELNKFKWLMVLGGTKLSSGYQLLTHFISTKNVSMIERFLGLQVEVCICAYQLILQVRDRVVAPGVNLRFLTLIDLSNLMEKLFTIFIYLKILFRKHNGMSTSIDKFLKKLVFMTQDLQIDTKLFKSWKVFVVIKFILDKSKDQHHIKWEIPDGCKLVDTGVLLRIKDRIESCDI